MIAWKTWARQVGESYHLSSAGKKVLGELAALADDVGVGTVTNRWISERLQVSDRTINRAFRELIDQGLVRKKDRYEGRKVGTRFELVETPVLFASDRKENIPPSGSGPVLRKPARIQVETGSTTVSVRALENLCRPKNFRALLGEYLHAGPGSQCEQLVARVLVAGGPTRFQGLANSLSGLPGAIDNPVAANFELISIAYDLTRENTALLASAGNPWGMLATMVKRQVLERYREAKRTNVLFSSKTISDGYEPANVCPPQAGSKDPLIEVDEYPKLEVLMRELVSHGLDEVFVRAVSVRLLQIAANTHEAQRAKFAKLDQRLADLGLSEQAAAIWMSLLVGGRKDKGIFEDEPDPELHGQRLKRLLCTLKTESDGSHDN